MPHPIPPKFQRGKEQFKSDPLTVEHGKEVELKRRFFRSFIDNDSKGVLA
jgi:hypothetical protein